MEQSHLTEEKAIAVPPPAPALRFSEWHVEPPAPPTLLQRLQRAHWERVLAVVAIATVIGLYLTVRLVFHFRGFSEAGQVILWLSIILWTHARYLRGHEEVSDLMEYPSELAQCPVEVSYSAFGVCYGEDIGVVTFIEGRMHFQGRRSSFDLSRADAMPPPWSQDKGHVSFWSTPKWRVVWGGEAMIDLIPLERIKGHDQNYRRLFRSSFEEWRGSSGRFQDSVLPPTTPLPKRIRQARIAPSVVRALQYFMYAVAVLTPVIYWVWHDLFTCAFLLIAATAVGFACMACAKSMDKAADGLRRLGSGERPEPFAISVEGRTLPVGDRIRKS